MTVRTHPLFWLIWSRISCCQLSFHARCTSAGHHEQLSQLSIPSDPNLLAAPQWITSTFQNQRPPPNPHVRSALQVFLVSALNGQGVLNMMDGLKQAMGFRSDLWVVGAQNAGKSSLINAMKKACGTVGSRDPTVAPLPGAATTAAGGISWGWGAGCK